MKLLVGFPQLIDEVTGPVRRVVVHNENAEIEVQTKYLLYQSFDVLALIIGWDYDECFHFNLLHRFEPTATSRTINAAENVITDIVSDFFNSDMS
jgi:hypothetical protein